MALPISRTQLDKLGERLVEADRISDEDYGMLEAVLASYDEALAYVQGKLVDLGFADATGRLKTTGTLTEKLRRERGKLSMKSVQDIAGVRIVLTGEPRRDVQDEAVRRIAEAFTDVPARIRDRRQNPSSGYRAVHLVVFHERLPVEVQVRTELQDLWAQIYERLGDQWGRQIRYGGPPDEPDRGIEPDSSMSRSDVIAMMQRVSGQIDAYERNQVSNARAEQQARRVVELIGTERADGILSSQARMQGLMTEFAEVLRSFLTVLARIADKEEQTR